MSASNTITFGTNLVPNDDLTNDLGTSDLKWNIFGNLTGTTSEALIKLDTTSKLYITGETETPTSNGVSVSLKANTKLFLSATQHLTAKALSIHDDGTTPAEKVYMQWNSTDQSLDFIFA